MKVLLKRWTLVGLAIPLFFSDNLFAQQLGRITSPDKKIEVRVLMHGKGQVYYEIDYQRNNILLPSQLGLVREDADFSQSLKLLSVSSVEKISDRYEMINAKKSNCIYKANRRSFHFKNADQLNIDIIFQVSNDGIAFRYFFPQKSEGGKIIREELTSYHLPMSAKAWLQPMQVAKSGWEATNPAYEEHYKENMDVGSPAPTKAGWVYPALFFSNNTWMLMTEAAVDSNYCATRLQAESANGIYRIAFPDPREAIMGGGTLPKPSLPYYSPWRIITVGSLNTITESTLGTDLAKPAIKIDQSFIHPGKASWSWINSKDDSIVYSEQKRYIDFAADMHWQYCLIDADWDRKIGYDKVKDLSAYAATKNVGLLLWYNSAGDWNTVKYTPKNKLLTHSSRMNEFNRLKEMGIKGVKIDFFGGDGQSVMKYYLEILQDAATAGLMVNFHGATVPRGWQRTYPHLMTTEAVRGFEMITFNQSDANMEPTHCAMLPFTRNAFDPMDFTPMNLYKIQTRVKRITTPGFELALSVLFLSGIQHYAESPAGMSQVPEYVRNFLRALPNHWDDVKFIEGYPGKYVVLARKAGNKWYIAGINGEDQEKTISLNLSFFKKSKASMIGDQKETASFINENWNLKQPNTRQITMQPNGGFVITLE